MAKYLVTVREVYTQAYEVEAENKQDALGKALDGEAIDGSFEWSHNLPQDVWTIEELEDEEQA